MLRRTFFAIGAIVAAAGKRLRGQTRVNLNQLANQQLAATPYKSAEIMAMESADLIQLLEDPESSEFARAKACQRLAVVGDEAAVPSLARLLSDPKLSHYARMALEPMPGESVDQPLREALASLEGELLIGVINSIGLRRDQGALKALATLRHGDDADVAAAATWAINRIRRP